jgi:hypothetical protein
MPSRYIFKIPPIHLFSETTHCIHFPIEISKFPDIRIACVQFNEGVSGRFPPVFVLDKLVSNQYKIDMLCDLQRGTVVSVDPVRCDFGRISNSKILVYHLRMDGLK